MGGVSTADITAHGAPSAEQLFEAVVIPEPTQPDPVPPTISLGGKDAGSVSIAISGGQHIDSLVMQYKLSSGTDWITADTLAFGATSFTFFGLGDETQYNFRVIAVNEWNDQASNVLTVTTDALPVPQVVAPTIAHAGTGSTSLSVTLSGGENIVTLTPQYRVNGDSEWISRAPISASSTSYNYTGLDPETSYDRRMLASNEGGSDESNILSDYETNAASGFEKLAEGHWIPAKMPMVIIAPRPDSETNSWARHRKQYPGLLYEFPVGVQGGAYPFFFEVDGPAGMTISSDWNDMTTYGILLWDNAIPGTHPITLTVTDHDDNVEQVSWNLVVTTDGHVFVDPNVETSGDGSIGSPIKLFSEVMGATRGANTHSGKTMYLRGGTHVVLGPEPGGNLQLEQSNKPHVWLGYPGEAVTLDAAAAVTLIGSGVHDLFVGGVGMANSRADVGNSRFFFATQSNVGHRFTFYNIDFTNAIRGTSGNDNPACVTAFNPGTLRGYWQIRGCTNDDYTAPICDLYSVSYAVIEGNVAGSKKGTSNQSPSQNIFLKSDIQYTSVRRNIDTEGNNYEHGAILSFNGGTANGYDMVEVCYNTVRTTNLSGSTRALSWAYASATQANDNPRHFFYRNTCIGKAQGLGTRTYTLTFENNILIHAETPFLQSSTDTATIIGQNNLYGRVADGILDGSYKLQNSFIEGYFGTHGAEIG